MRSRAPMGTAPGRRVTHLAWLVSRLATLATLAVSLGTPPAATAAVTLTFASGTSTQLVLSYTTPNATACTIEASESPSLTPLVPDVNAALFPGANRDDRLGSLVLGST